MNLSPKNIEELLWFGDVGFVTGSSNFNELRQLGLVQRTRSGPGKRSGFWRWTLTKAGKQEYNIQFARHQCKSCIDFKFRNLDPKDCKSCMGKGYTLS